MPEERLLGGRENLVELPLQAKPEDVVAMVLAHRPCAAALVVEGDIRASVAVVVVAGAGDDVTAVWYAIWLTIFLVS